MVLRKSRAQAFLRNKRGNTSILFGLSLIPTVLISGGTVDYGNVLAIRAQLQAAADAAAFAGNAPVNATATERQTIALNVFNANTQGTRSQGITPTITATGTTVTVNVSENVRTPFLGVANIPTMPAVASATASGTNSTTTNTSTTTSTTTTNSADKICLLALDPASPDGIRVGGTPNMRYPNCWAHTNSTLATAINGNGTPSVIGQGHCAVGGVSLTSPSLFSPTVTTGCPAVADPYATVGAYSGGTYTPTFTPPTKATTCTQLNYSIKKATVTLSPGRYCGGMNLQAQANVTLQPGIYYIDNGALNVQAGASLSGSNVLIYLEGASASATLIGGGTVNLSGRTVGNSYAGFLMIAAPNVTANTTIQGGGVFKMEGTVYVPKSRIELGGNGDINNPGVAVAGMVAKDFYLRGNGTFNYKRRTGAAATSGQVPDIMPFKPVLTTTTVTTSTQSTTRKTVLSD